MLANTGGGLKNTQTGSKPFRTQASINTKPQTSTMKKFTAFFAIALSGLFASQLSAAIVLESVNWGSFSGNTYSGSWSFGNVGGTTASGVSGAGSVFNVNWAGLPYAAGYSTTINEGVGLGAAANTTATQTLTFSQSVSSLYMFVSWVDNGTSFNFGSYDWTLVGGNSASRSGSSVVVSGSNDQQSDGFLVNINETFGPGTDFVFNFVNNTRAL